MEIVISTPKPAVETETKATNIQHSHIPAHQRNMTCSYLFNITYEHLKWFPVEAPPP